MCEWGLRVYGGTHVGGGAVWQLACLLDELGESSGGLVRVHSHLI